MGNYIGFLPLSTITPEALQAVAAYATPLQANIVCRYEDVVAVDALYKLLGDDYPGYIPTMPDIADSYQRVAQSCDILFIYWDGSNKRNRLASEIDEKPAQTYIVLPSGYIMHFSEDYKDAYSGKVIEDWIYRPDAIDYVPLDRPDENWDGLFAGQHFFLSAMSSMPTPIDDGCLYPSLLHALTALSIDNEIYRDFFMNARIPFTADFFSWLKDFNIEINPLVFNDLDLISQLVNNRFKYNQEFFEQHPIIINRIQPRQSYPTDTYIAQLLLDQVEPVLLEPSQEGINSPIVYTTGDMFDKADDGVLFIPVNCKGSMGAGLALDAAERFPEVESVYKKACKDGSLAIGKPLLTQSKTGKILLLFPTKNDWKNGSKIEYIESGIRYFYENIINNQIGLVPLHIPKLGCGLGGLDWQDVNPIIEKYFNGYGSSVYVYV